MSKILFAGCSSTATSGFNEENVPKYHWPHILAKHYRCEFDNIAIGGAPNNEIFLRTIDALIKNNYQYDLVVIMWTSMSREWRYFERNNVDDFLMLHSDQIGGFVPDAECRWAANEYKKLHYSYFNNMYVDLKHWLLNTIALESVLKKNNINYVFAKAFGNLIYEFTSIEHNTNQFVNINSDIKEMLDLDHRPDSYILEKIQDIQRLIQQLDQQNFIELQGPGFMQSAWDFADDRSHAGIQTNQAFAEKLIKHCSNFQL